jgi:hypothetical protein
MFLKVYHEFQLKELPSLYFCVWLVHNNPCTAFLHNKKLNYLFPRFKTTKCHFCFDKVALWRVGLKESKLAKHCYYTRFHLIGFFNEADTLESSSKLIYSELYKMYLAGSLPD